MDHKGSWPLDCPWVRHHAPRTFFCCDQFLDQASLTIRLQCGPHRHRCLQPLLKKKSHKRAASKHCRRSPRCGHGHYAASFAAIASDATVRDCSCQQECQLIWTFLPDVLLSCPMYYNNRCSLALPQNTKSNSRLILAFILQDHIWREWFLILS